MYYELGMLPEASFVMEKFEANAYQTRWWYECKAYVAQESFDFAKAHLYYKQANDFEPRLVNEIGAFMSLFESGQIDKVDAWLEELDGEYDSEWTPVFVNARLAIARGEYDEGRHLLSDHVFKRNIKLATRLSERYIILADCALLQDDKALALEYVRAAHYFAPRKRRVSYLYQLALGKQSKELQRYGWTMKQLFSNDTYWIEFQSAAGEDLLNESEDELYQQFCRYRDMVGSSAINDSFMIQNPAMDFEYICLRLLKSERMDYYDQIVDIYTHFVPMCSREYLKLTRPFLVFMKNRIKHHVEKMQMKPVTLKLK
jgi:hypothetical protein